MPTCKVILPATKAAATSKEFQLTNIPMQIATVQCIGLADKETACVQWQNFADGTWSDYWFNDQAQSCSVTSQAVHLSQSGNFRVRKDATTADVAISVLSNKDVLVV